MILLSLGAVLSYATFLTPTLVNAEDANCSSEGRTFLGVFRSWDNGLKHEGSGESCHVVIEKGGDGIPSFIWTVVLNIFYDISVAAGLIAVVMIIYNGFQYMTSGGSSDKVSNAKKGLTQSIIGLVITLLAATIIRFITENLF